MESAKRSEAGLSLEEITNSFVENHLAESVEIDLGILRGGNGHVSIKVRVLEKIHEIKRFFEYLDSRRTDYDAMSVRVCSGYMELSPDSDGGTCTFRISPANNQYSEQSYIESARKVLSNIPRAISDFKKARA